MLLVLLVFQICLSGLFLLKYNSRKLPVPSENLRKISERHIKNNAFTIFMVNMTKVRKFFNEPDIYTYWLMVIIAILWWIWFIQTAFLK